MYTKIVINYPKLVKCVEMVSRFDPSLVPSDHINQEVERVVQAVKSVCSNRQWAKDPFTLHMISLGNNIFLTFIQHFEADKQAFSQEAVQCMFSVIPNTPDDNPTFTVVKV